MSSPEGKESDRSNTPESMAQRLARQRLERSNSRSSTPRSDSLSSRGSRTSSKPSTTLNLGTASKSVQEDGLAALGSLSARDFIDAGLEKAKGQTSEQMEVELGQLSARAFIGVGLEEHTKVQTEEEMGQASARKFIGLGLDAMASTKGENVVEEFAQLTARSAIAN